jgi:pyruvate formate lyase activating enzyme
LRFAGFQKTSLIDYPDRVASILFTTGCNLRCPYCHNGDLVEGYTGPFQEGEDIIEVLIERKHHVDSIVISGGEPTMDPGLPEFLGRLRGLGFDIKLDTNGLKPDALRECLPYLSFIAMDIKTSLENYKSIGTEDTASILESIKVIMGSGLDYEFRCTAVPGFVETETIHKMGEMVRGAKTFVFQQYKPEKTLDPKYNDVGPHSEERIREFAAIMEDYVEKVLLRV